LRGGGLPAHAKNQSPCDERTVRGAASFKAAGAAADAAGVGISRRRRRLAIAGILWTLVVLWILGAVVPRPRASSSLASIRVEHGRVPAEVPARSSAQDIALLGHVVAVLARLGADVRCSSGSPWRAYTTFAPLPTVTLGRGICSELTRLAHDDRPVWRDESPDALAWSVETLAHESMHVSGIRNEPTAECYGMQTIRAAAVGLGRTAYEGRYLATLYWRHWYPWIAPSYRSRECRNGGRLDLRFASDVWP
jgi:hypothetical protein